MALTLADRVKQYTTSTGTGDISFTGTPTGFRSFSSVLTTDDLTYYAIEENDKWEVGIGTYGSDNMVRSYVIASSNSNNHVNLGGSGTVFVTYAADKSVYRDQQSQVVVGASGLLFNNGTVVKDAKIVELTDVNSSGAISSTHLLSFNNTNKSLLIGDVTGPSNSNTTLIGYGAGSGITSASDSVVIGTEAAIANNTGTKNVNLGVLAGPSETAYTSSVSNAVSVGYKAGSRMRNNSTALGYQAGMEAYEFGFVAVGADAGFEIGSYSVGVGNEAAYEMSSDYVVAVGYQAAKSAAGESSVWVGNMAGASATSATYSVGVGYQAGKSSSANDSIYIGKSAGQSNSSNDYLYIGNGAPSSNRTLIKGDMQSKRLAVGDADITLGDTFHVGIATSTDVGLVVKSAVSQSADLPQWQTSADGVVAAMTTSGVLNTYGVAASGAGVTLANGVPAVTSYVLYNDGGTLTWNGSALAGGGGGVTEAQLVYVSGIAVYGSGQAESLTYASGLTATNASNISTNTSNISTNTTNITSTTAVANYASGEAVSLNYASGVAAYSSGVVTGGIPTFDDMYVDEYIYHNGDTHTYIRFRGDQLDFVAGNVTMLTLDEATNDKVIINTGGNDIDFVVEGENDTNLIKTDAANDLVGIGTSSPSYKLDVVGHDAWVRASGVIVGNSGVVLANNAPAVTTNTLYNDGGTLKFDGSAVGGGDVTTAQLVYVSGQANYASGQALSLTYASGLTATNASNISTNTSNISTNTSNITSTTSVANYASGEAVSLNYASGVAAYASGQAIENETNLDLTAAWAAYASGNTQNIHFDYSLMAEGDILYMNAANKFVRLAKGTDNHVLTMDGNVPNWETSLGTSLLAASGQAVYASGNTANIAFGSNVEGDILYHNGTTFTRLAKGTDNHVLTMDGNVPNWEASAGGGGGDVTTAELTYVSGIAVYGSGQAESLGYASGVAAYASGQAVSLTYASGLTATNATNITSTTAVANYASGEAVSLTYASGLTATNATNITSTLAVANYASGEALSLNTASGIAAYASGQAIANETDIATNTGNISTNTTNITATTAVANYASGEALSLNSASGLTVGTASGIVFYDEGGGNLTSSGTFVYDMGNGSVGIAVQTPGAQLHVASSANTTIGNIVQGAVSQSADLTSWQNSADFSVAAMTPSGVLNTYGVVASGAGYTLDGNSGSDTSVLFNNEGVIGGGDDLLFNSSNSPFARDLIVGNTTVGIEYPQLLVRSQEGFLPMVTLARGAGDYSSDAKSNWHMEVSDYGFSITQGNNVIARSTSRTHALTADNNRNIGIGTTAPSYKLDVVGHDAWARASGVIVGNSGVVLANNTPAVTTNTLYNAGGTLTWNGSAVGGTSAEATYASGQALSLTYASGLTATNASNIVATSGIANYASGLATYNSGAIVFISGALITSNTNIATNTTNIGINEGNITTARSIANYASGEALSLNTASGIAAYASGNTANIDFGSNAQGDILYHNGTTFTRLAKGTDNHVLTMDGSNPNWEAAAGGSSTGPASGYVYDVQYNGDGVNLGGTGNFTFNPSSNILNVNGHIAASTKSFVISHPMKSGKRLQYACLEGPENGVYVRGYTDSNIIDLPDYWTALVDLESITVQLTAKDAPQPYLYVGRIDNNQVHLISDRQISASYVVNATRKDVPPLEVEI